MTISKPKHLLPWAIATEQRALDVSAPPCDHTVSPARDSELACRENDPEECCARVVAVDRGRYIIRGTLGEVPAKLTGRAGYASDFPVDLPCVGDWVRVGYHDAGAHARILELLPRKSELKRRKPGSDHEYQMIAANIDVAFIVQSCHYDFNVRRLERYLVMANEGKIEPVILLTKTDLVSAESREELLAQIRQAGISTPVIALSNVSGAGFAQVHELILPGKTYCLLGSSGVGKTSLVNRLLGGQLLATNTVSDSGEGRHTTTRRQLIALEQGGFLIDMPGMRELGVLGIGEGPGDGFSDIREHALSCRFANCSHTNEPGCAILAAIAQGELDAGHFNNYLKLQKEADFQEMSHLEKRRKARAFGKMVRSVSKAKARRGEC